MHFEWLHESKAVSSIVLGSTPEFEIALYSMCFLGGQEQNLVTIAEYDLKIRSLPSLPTIATGAAIRDTAVPSHTKGTLVPYMLNLLLLIETHGLRILQHCQQPSESHQGYDTLNERAHRRMHGSNGVP